MTIGIGAADGYHGDRSRNPDVDELLDDPHCRSLLECLERADEPVGESALARHVTAGVTESSPEEVPDPVMRRVVTWLHHGQLPALASAGLVDYDPDAGEARLADG